MLHIINVFDVNTDCNTNFEQWPHWRLVSKLTSAASFPKSRCGWGPYLGCLKFINDNVGYFEGTHVGTCLSLKKLSGLTSLVLRLLSIKPILYEKYLSLKGCR